MAVSGWRLGSAEYWIEFRGLNRVQGKEYGVQITESMEARGWEADLGL